MSSELPDVQTLNVNNPMKASNVECRLKHCISTIVICGTYRFEFNVSKDMKKNNDKMRIP